jgi:sulfur carrier protein
MRVTINGDEQALESGLTLSDLVAARGAEPRRVAIEVNAELVLRADYGNTEIHEGDRIEIVTFVGGG